MASRPARASTLALAITAALLLATTPSEAAYEESHVTGDEARVTVDAAGGARVEHTLAWHLVAGQPRTIDLAGVEPTAHVDPTASLESDEGRIIPASVAMLEGRGIRVMVTEPKTLRRGHYRVRLAYTVDLHAAGELVRDGASFRLVWKGPTPREGYDTVKVTFVLPGALEEPRPIVGEGGMPDDGVLTALKRGPDHDELEMLRPHVGRGEEVLWAARVSAKAFEAGKVAAPPPPPPLRALEARGHAPSVYGALLLLALGFLLLVHLQERRFNRACRRYADQARGLIPLRPLERATLAGACLFVGLSLQLADATILGTVFVAMAMACAALRPPRATPLPRGPGRWLRLRDRDIFGAEAADAAPPGPSGALDAAGFVTGLLALVLAGYLLRAVQPQAALLLALDAAVLLPLVLTGKRGQLPPDLIRSERAWLAKAFARLQKERSLNVSPWVRVPTGGTAGDELRVLAVPHTPLPGLVAIELGASFIRTATSFAPAAEVLVRVHEATPAGARMAALAPSIVPVPGRQPEERVYRLVPDWPTVDSAAALVRDVARDLVDRRHAAVAWDAEERRAPLGLGLESAEA